MTPPGGTTITRIRRPVYWQVGFMGEDEKPFELYTKGEALQADNHIRPDP
jgi:hypothetical protein